MKFKKRFLVCLIIETFLVISEAGTLKAAKSSGTDSVNSLTSVPLRPQLSVQTLADHQNSSDHPALVYHLGSEESIANDNYESFKLANSSARYRRDLPSDSEASEAKCVDDIKNKIFAPAQYCFDYFMLALSWAPGYAFKQGFKNIEPGWSIHGLWPTMLGGRRPMTKCPLNIDFKLDDKFKKDLQKEWHSITNNKHEAFWSYEYNKHGKCAMRSAAIGANVKNYFETTLNLNKALLLPTYLKMKGYDPGKEWPLGKILEYIKQKTGKQGKILHVYNPAANRTYLAEIYICYDIQLQIRDCPNTNPKNEWGEGIFYVPKLLK